MSDTPPNRPDDDVPEWWKRLNAEEQAFLRRIMGKDWQPSRREEVERAFDLTRERIRQIEQRALKKLRGRGGDDNK
jgi:DNA-directed RNA polymerase sigma subunit (sigma70/sigma32)